MFTQAAPGFALEFNVPLPLVLGLLLSVIIPLLVGLVTKKTTDSGLKAVLLAILAAVTGLLTELLRAVEANVPYDLGVGLLMAIGALVTAIALHYGLWKPTGASERVQAIGSGGGGGGAPYSAH